MRPLTSPSLIFLPLCFLFQYITVVVQWPCVLPSNNPLLCLVYTQNPDTIGNYLIYFSVNGQHTISTRGNTNKPLFYHPRVLGGISDNSFSLSGQESLHSLMAMCCPILGQHDLVPDTLPESSHQPCYHHRTNEIMLW